MDDGRLVQAIVEYTGGRPGTVSYRGASGGEFRFGGFPSQRERYVLEQDAEHSWRPVDFRVLDEGRIDPEADRLKRVEKDIADRVLRQIASLRGRDQTSE
jgi:hypothetical protein